MKIGDRVRRLRMQRGLTQEELANRCELSKGFISLLERDLTSPSVDTLTDILESLGTDLKNFFSDFTDEKVVFSDADMSVKEDGEAMKGFIKWLVPSAQKNRMEPILIELPSGGESFEVEPHSGEEFGYVIEGSVVLICDGECTTVRKGETFYLQGHSFHHLKNERKTTARVLWVSTPPLF